jgi:hypothetical protein
MTQSHLAFVIGSSFVFFTAVSAAAQNNSAQTAAHLMPGQPPAKVDIDAGDNTERWYDFRTFPERSYCVEVTTWQTETRQIDPSVTVYSPLNFPIVSADAMLGEPGGYFQARACFMTTQWLHGAMSIKVSSSVAGESGSYALRIVDTTMFCVGYQGISSPTWSGDSTTHLFNTTDQTITVNAKWRIWIYEFRSGPIPLSAHRDYELSSMQHTGTYGQHQQGNVEIWHDGPPDGIIAVQRTNGALGAADVPYMYSVPCQSRRTW